MGRVIDDDDLIRRGVIIADGCRGMGLVQPVVQDEVVRALAPGQPVVLTRDQRVIALTAVKIVAHWRTVRIAISQKIVAAIPGQYIGDGSHLMAARPVFRHDHTGELVQVSFNDADRAPFALPHDEMVAVYDALRAFDLLANDPASQWRHVLRPGEALLFDNWRVLHGRTAYRGQRRLCGAYFNHEDFESHLRQAPPTFAAHTA